MQTTSALFESLALALTQSALARWRAALLSACILFPGRSSCLYAKLRMQKRRSLQVCLFTKLALKLRCTYSKALRCTKAEQCGLKSNRLKPAKFAGLPMLLASCPSPDF